MCRIAFRVGIVGTRLLDPASAASQQDAMRDVLADVREVCVDLPSNVVALYSPGEPILRVVTSIAEGADRIGGRVALDLGFELDCVLPFERSQFALDFESSSSVEEYEGLLGRARAVFELDGSRSDERSQGLAYATASQRVLAQSDLLIALWTGTEAKGPGGTATTVRAALRAGTPVVWIDANDPEKRFIADAEGAWLPYAAERLRDRMVGVLSPHSGSGATADHTPRTAYFQERRPRFAPLNGSWRAFRALVLRGGAMRPRAMAARFEQDAAREWDSGWEATPQLPLNAKQTVAVLLRGQFTWADGLSDYYANQYRSMFVLIYALGALAVFLAVLGQAVGIDEAGGGGEVFKAAISLGTILAIIGLRQLGQRQRWHDRWIDYRLLAEFVRQMGFLAPLCLAPPRTQQPVHRSAQDPGNSWMGWHARAIAREMGIVNAVLNAEYLHGVRALLRDGWVGHQHDYHVRNARTHKQMARRLQGAGTAILVATIAGILLLLVTGAPAWSLVTAVLPAAGAGLAGIRSQAEMDRIARRSEAITLGLEEFRDALDRVVVAEASGASVRLSNLAEALTIAMTDDVLDWRIVFDSRQLEVQA